MSENKTTHIPNFSYPFKKLTKEKEYHDSLIKTDSGNYLFNKQGFWHGGIHFEDETLTEVQQSDGIRAIANGELVALRINNNYLENDENKIVNETKEEKDKQGLYSNGFFLLKHYLEYPTTNKLTFFSLYMHTAKKDKYDLHTHKMLKKDTIRSIEKYIDSNTGKIKELEKDTKLILGDKNQFGRYQIHQIDAEPTSGICTVDDNSVIKIDSSLTYPKDYYKLINKNTKTDNIIFPKEKIEIKAGEVIGLVGEYNIPKQKNNKLLHLETFTKDDVKTFAQKAKEYYENPNTKKEDKPNPTQLKIPKGIKRYIKEEKTIYEVIPTNNYTNLRKAYLDTQNGYKTSKRLNKDIKIQIDESTLNSDRYLVIKIEEAEVKEQGWTVHKDYIEKTNTEITFIETTVEIEDEYIIKLSEIEKRIKDKNDIEYLDTNVESIEPKLYIKYKDCKEIHPISFEWADIIENESEDKVSIFKNIKDIIDPMSKNEIKINPMFEELFKYIDKNTNGQLEPQELEEATKDKVVKEVCSKIIVKHSNEWHKETNLPNEILKIVNTLDKKSIKNRDTVIKHLESEKKRVDNLAFFDKCSSIADFPKSDEVYHFNPIGLVGEFGNQCNEIISKELMKKAFKDATDLRINEYHPVINQALCIYKLNDMKSIAYFIGQASAETLDLKYKEEIASGLAYEGRTDLGNIQVGDGKRFKGRGMIQLTGRTNYEAFQKYARENFANYKNLDITSSDKNAQKLVTNLELNVLASLWYWKESIKGKKIHKQIQSSNTNIFWISVHVNGWQVQKHPYYPEKEREPNHMKKRVERTNIAKNALGVE